MFDQTSKKPTSAKWACHLIWCVHSHNHNHHHNNNIIINNNNSSNNKNIIIINNSSNNKNIIINNSSNNNNNSNKQQTTNSKQQTTNNKRTQLGPQPQRHITNMAKLHFGLAANWLARSTTSQTPSRWVRSSIWWTSSRSLKVSNEQKSGCLGDL